MPEIPEVLAFGLYIKKHCLHKIIFKVQVACPQLIKNMSGATFTKLLIEDQFMSVARRGKYLIINLKKSGKKLVMHFGLTGSLGYLTEFKKIRFSCVTFIFKDHSELHYTSIRKFGKLLLVDSLDEIKELRKLGFEPDALTQKQFLNLMAENERKNVKEFLMDQSLIAGIGNEYSDEILFQSSVDPRRAVSDLSLSEKKRIFKQIDQVLKYAIKVRIKNLNDISEGGFFSRVNKKSFKQSYLQAHRRTDGLCPHNKNHHLIRVKIGGRSSYFCPIDQK